MLRDHVRSRRRRSRTQTDARRGMKTPLSAPQRFGVRQLAAALHRVKSGGEPPHSKARGAEKAIASCLGILLCAFACTRGSENEIGPAGQPPVIIISIDTL